MTENNTNLNNTKTKSTKVTAHALILLRNFFFKLIPKKSDPNLIACLLINNVKRYVMEPPVRPNESDCCNSGCNPCILDVYELQLKKYKAKCTKNRENCISPIVFTKFKLSESTKIADDVFILKFDCYESGVGSNSFYYNPGQYLLLKGKDCDGEFTRAYTPIPLLEDFLGFTILVKICSLGRMSQLLEILQIGEETAWRGPYGNFNINYSYKYLLCVAQGTGIAPIYSILKDILSNDECETFVKLFFCCKSPKAIFLRDKLYELSSYWNFSCEIFLSDTNNLVRKYNETIHDSKLSYQNLEKHIRDKVGNIQILICGSENFNNSIENKVVDLVEKNHIHLF